MTRGRKGSSCSCKVEDCTTIATNYGYCSKHWHRLTRHGDLNTVKNMRNKGKICSVEGCEQNAFAKNYCQQHYDSVTKHGREYLISAPDGSGYSTKDGYREYTINGEKVLEHVMLAEKALGKKLPPKTVIHHMNGIKDDNFTPLNLVICPDQAYHMLIHKRTRDLEKRNAIEQLSQALRR